MKKNIVALIPARSGSKRVPNKNITLLNGHPMIAYTIQAAIESNIFDTVVCATDTLEYSKIAEHYGAKVPFLRSKDISADKSPDIDWVNFMIDGLSEAGQNFEYFSILRPTSPFRLASTIKKAAKLFFSDMSADSLRAIEKCNQHPGKMWTLTDQRMHPLMPFKDGSTPWHSSQYASLPEIYVQNASLEIAKTAILSNKNSISGDSIIPFLNEGLEGFDINNPEDLILANHYIKTSPDLLPEIRVKRYSK